MSLSVARIWAVLQKEYLQMKRDPLTLAMLVMVPVMQLLLFGYAINNDPKHLPTAMLVESPDEISRSVQAALSNSDYFHITRNIQTYAEAEDLLKAGKVNFVIQIPAGFSRELVRGEHPVLRVTADATDPTAVGSAIAHLPTILAYGLAPFARDGHGIAQGQEPASVVVHSAFNPEGITQWNIIPGLLGVILSMTTVMITAITMTRERERGTMENLLAMPARPAEVMIGKVVPYIGMGLVQTLLILAAGKWVFGVPFMGDISLLVLGLALFLPANLSLGFTFSTIAKNQLQAMQMTFFYFLPSILLSGFMFPFRGMPGWAQWLGEALPLTHFLRILRGVILKNADFMMLWPEFAALAAFWAVVLMLAMLGYKRTL